MVHFTCTREKDTMQSLDENLLEKVETMSTQYVCLIMIIICIILFQIKDMIKRLDFQISSFIRGCLIGHSHTYTLYI